jgi:uncharacterized protein
VSVVSNASPLINLARIDKLHLLHDLYDHLIIPEAVWREIVVEGTGQPGADEVKGASWIEMHAVANRQLVRALQQELDAGEAEAIILALEKEAELLVMDERLGRETACHLGLRYTGVIGVLVEAKHKGLISAVKPHLDALREAVGFRVSDVLHLRVLQNEGEK